MCAELNVLRILTNVMCLRLQKCAELLEQLTD